MTTGEVQANSSSAPSGPYFDSFIGIESKASNTLVAL